MKKTRAQQRPERMKQAKAKRRQGWLEWMGIAPNAAAAAGFAGMLLVYFGTLSLFNSPSHALAQFRGDWWWVLAFAAGMAGQLWLSVKIHASTAATGASAGTSTGTMIACCAHHITDLAPLAGAAFLAGLFDKYQPLFIGIGLLSNAVGLSLLLSHAQEQELKVPFARLLDWTRAWKFEAAIGAGLLAALAFKLYLA
jgi:hypothetical protein